MKKSPEPSVTSETSSSISLEDLLQSQKSTTKTRPKSHTALIVHPGKEKRGTDGSIIRSPRVRKALEAFEDSLGGREALVDALEFATLNDKEKHLLSLMSDPQRSGDTLATIARDAGLTASQVLDLFRSATFAKAHTLVMGKISEALPDIVEDMAGKSVDKEVLCPECFGEDLGELTCMKCHGRGTIFRGSDLDRQKLLMEAAGVIKKGPGVNVQVNQQVNNIQPGSFFSKFVRSSDENAYDVIDVKAEKVEDGQ